MPHRRCRDGIESFSELDHWRSRQKRYEHGSGLSAVFVDLVKAVDSGPRAHLYRVMEKFGIPTKIMEIIVNNH